MQEESNPTPIGNSMSKVQDILRLDATIAYVKKPENLTCTHCHRELEPFSAIWPRWNQVKKVTEWVTIWPQYTCEKCLAVLESKQPVPMSERLTTAGLYGKNRAHTFGSFRSNNQILARALHEAENFARGCKGNLWLYGAPGTGKTHLACGIIHVLLGKGKEPIFAETPILLQDLIDNFLDPTSPLIQESKWAKCPLLVLDDLGTEKLTERGLELLTTVINTRSLFDLPTVVTSNLKPGELHDQASERLISRLVENGRIVNTGQDDWRKRRR